MKKLTLTPIIFLLIFLIQSCATTKQVVPEPVVQVIEKERIIAKPFEAVWQSLIELLATYNMPIKNLDKSSGFIATEYKAISGDVLLIYVNCVGANSTFMGKVELVNHGGNLNVLLKRISDDSTKVRVNTFYSCSKNTYKHKNLISMEYVLQSSTRIDCTSTGNLEKAILDYVSIN